MGTKPCEETFAIKFLQAPPELLRGRGWRDDLQNEFISLLRTKLTGTSVRWVNPVVLLVFKHPESIVRQRTISWDEWVRESLYQPVAQDNTTQRALDSAYQMIVAATDRECGHLSPFFLKATGISGTHCYRCEYGENGTPEISVFKCASSASSELLLDTVPNVSHYAKLFELSNPVWFLPSPLFSLTAAQSELYDEYLVGTYVGLANVNGLCACRTRSETRELRAALDWAIPLLFIRRLKDQGKAFLNVMEEYQKHMQMLHLLETPLNRLSDALSRMQEDTQRLRAVLYDPSRAIFAAAPKILEYFEEGRTIRHGEVSWVATHDPHRSEVDVRVLRCTLAAIVCEIFGGLVTPPENDGALWDRAQRYLTANLGNEDVAHKRLREQCTAIMGIGQAAELPSDRETLKHACSNFQDILYRPYKDGDTNWSLLAALIIFFDVFSELEVSIQLNDKEPVRYMSLGESMTSWSYPVPIFCGLDLPVARYSHWLSFIHGILSYARHDQGVQCAKVDISIKEAADTNVSIMFFRKEDQKSKMAEVFPPTAIRAISKDIRDWFGRKDVVVNKGNFAKPFVDYAMGAEGQLKKGRGRVVLSFEHGAQDRKCKTEVHLGIGSFRYRTTKLN